MACKSNPFMNNPTPVEEKRWSKLQVLNPTPNNDRGDRNNELNVTCDRFKTVDMGERMGESMGERTNTFASTNDGKPERIYSSFAAFTKKTEKPKKIFDMEQMTDDALNDEFPSLC